MGRVRQLEVVFLVNYEVLEMEGRVVFLVMQRIYDISLYKILFRSELPNNLLRSRKYVFVRAIDIIKRI